MNARVPGLMLATVLKEAPDDLGRIKVSYDDRPDNPPSNWVSIVRPMASGGFGVWFAPEEGDKIVVAFLNGNLDSPYMMGSIYTGSKEPPVTEPKQRVIRSSQGHEIILDDTDGSETITLKDANDNMLVMDGDGITITSSGKITLDGAEIVIKGSSSIDIETQGQLTGKGQPIHLNP